MKAACNGYIFVIILTSSQIKSLEVITPILIINYNGYADTLLAVDSCLNQSIANCRVYLIDNASTNLEGDKLAAFYANQPRVRIIQSAENLGFGKACNLLLSIAKKELNFDFVALLNNDAIADRHWLANLLNCAADTGVDMVASKMLQMANPVKLDNAGHLFLNTAEIIPIGYDEAEKLYNKRFENMGPCAGAALYSSKMIENIGFFDPYFFVGYEDAELGLRGIVAGYCSVFEPKAIVLHKMGESIKKIFDFKYSKRIQTDIYYSYFKLMPNAFLWFNFPFMVFKYLTVLLMNLLFFRFKFLKVLLAASFDSIFKERRMILKARADFYKKPINPISFWHLQQKSVFFLWFDIKRFWKYIILRKKMQFEKY